MKGKKKKQKQKTAKSEQVDRIKKVFAWHVKELDFVLKVVEGQ